MELLFLNMTKGLEFMFPLIRLQNLKLRENFFHMIKKFLRDSWFVIFFWMQRLEQKVLILIKCLCIILTLLHLIVYILRRHYIVCWSWFPILKMENFIYKYSGSCFWISFYPKYPTIIVYLKVPIKIWYEIISSNSFY